MNPAILPAINRILVATDLDAGGDAALRLADKWARAFDASFGVVSVATGTTRRFSESMVQAPFDPGDREPDVHEEVERRRLAIETRVRQLTGRSRETFPCFVEYGVPVDEIVARTETYSADVLVVGGRKHSRLERMLLGSVATSLLRKAPCAVLVARDTGDDTGPVVAACDLAATTTEVLGWASRAASAHGTQLIATHAVAGGLSDAAALATATFSGIVPPTPNPEQSRELHIAARGALEASMTAAGAQGRVYVDTGESGAFVLETAKGWNASLIVVGSRHHSAPARWVLGSVSERIAREADCSVLLARDRVARALS